MKKNIFLLILAVITSYSLQGQVKYIGSFDEDVVVSGTSTLHDWSMATRGAASEATFTIDDQDVITKISDVVFTMQVKNLKSGKNGMDQNAYKVLKASKFPTIKAISKNVEITTAEGTIYTAKAVMNLSIAGVTKEVVIPVFVSEKANGIINVKGEKVMKLTDFNMEPPSFMFGTVTTGDEISLSFNINYQK